MASEQSVTREGYCPRCEERREIRVTVAWQSDFCADCGAEIDG